jgi:tetratricopeptide (TPR) repeat protein
MTVNPIAAISAAMRAGDLAHVERLCRAALIDQPQREELWLFLAISLQFQKRLDEAIAAYSQLTALFPDNGTHWSNYATALREAGALEEAEKAFAQSIRLNPRNQAAYLNLGLLLMQRQDYLGARETLLDAFDINRQLPLVRIHAASACCRCQDFERAEELLRPWRQWLPLGDTELQLELSNQLLLLSDGPGAQLLLEDLVLQAPDNFEARIRLVSIYERMNRLADAESVLDAIIAAGLVNSDERRNAIDHARASLALRRRDPAQAKSLLEAAGPRHAQDAPHYFDLADTYDKLGDYDRAMQALREAHAIKIEEIKRVAPEHFRADAPAGPTALPNVTEEEYRSWPRLNAPDSRNSPVFIVGFPRSGTTLLEQMLDAHPGLQSMDENPFFNRLADTLRRHDSRILGNLEVLRQFDVDELRKRYLTMVSVKVQRQWNAQLVDKNPLNMLWLPFIHRLFPNSKYILALRHPCDVLLSCYMQNFRSSILLTASESLERLARAYVTVMECWLHHVDVLQPQVLISRYEDLVGDFPRQAGRIAQFLELDDAAPMLKFDQHARDKGYIGTPSYSQVIEPVNTKGLNRWHRYREHFEPALPILGPMLRHWGYSTEPASV